MFNQNVDALIDALTNVDNPAFDINKSSKMLGEYLQQNTKKRYDYNYDIAVKASTNKGATGSQIIYANSNLGEKSFVLQDDILDKAMKNETIYSWGGDRFDPDPENPGNYIQEGTNISKPIDGLLRGKHFGMNERINSRKLEYPTGLPNVNTEVIEEESDEEKVEVTEIADEKVVSVRLGGLHLQKSNVKKINGKWHKSWRGDWEEIVDPNQLERIQKLYK
jgi:hypothetical protein